MTIFIFQYLFLDFLECKYFRLSLSCLNSVMIGAIFSGLRYARIILLFLTGIFLFLSLISYNSLDLGVSPDATNMHDLSNIGGYLGAFISETLVGYFGMISFIFPIVFILWGVALIRDIKIRPSYKILAVMLSCMGFAAVLSSFKNFVFYFDSLVGGFVGYFINIRFLDEIKFAPFIYIAIFVVSTLLLVYGACIIDIFLKKPEKVKKIKVSMQTNTGDAKQPKEKVISRLSVAQNNGYIPPSLSLLHRTNEDNKNKGVRNISSSTSTKNNLVQVLGDFGIKGNIVDIKVGPVVTVYELEPDAGIRSARIIGLSDDIARYLKASSCRITIIPGKGTLGIEIPNKDRETVYFYDMLSSNDYNDSGAILPIALGKSIYGEPIVADLSRMPHLLIAGTTGSGKSVGVNSIILSLIYRLSPEECRFIMIDPKMLELSVYEGIPHLLTPVITDPTKAVYGLKWVVKEMERRYKLMSEMGVRNIIGYNAAIQDSVQKLPYIVVIVDEMADLMLVAGKAIETSVQRLAQMARASGIHLILATQRPSVDVITGVIKANFPTRISFQVASSTDSRTVLGGQGAEKLLGQGDMLYMPTGGKMIRIHGPFVSDNEVTLAVDYLRQTYPTKYLDDVANLIEDAENFASTDLDDKSLGDDAADSGDLYEQAVQIVLVDKKPSISYVQRKLRIGYNKAANLIEKMQEDGIVSEPDHTGKRMILKK